MKLNAKIPAEIITLLSSITDENRLSDTIAAHLNLKLHDKQLLLESCDLLERFQRLVSHLEHEINILQLEKRISSRVKDQVKKKSQEEYYLTEKCVRFRKKWRTLAMFRMR